ncbi:MAG: SpoIIE family protein phosphatase [Acidimicrobiales bacterium]|nr:SpoIIE family protein phosphatase [Acidimicrobiales bacterium]MCB9395696.1 SpoIIE family protein phosphatase [Acidimicrobiaceae bacterium]
MIENEREVDLGLFRPLAEALPHLVWCARSDGSVVYYNPRLELYRGLRPDGLGAYEWTPVVHPDDVLLTRSAWERAVESGTEYECEHRLHMADGSFRWHVSRALPFRTDDEDAASTLWFGTATDTQLVADARAEAARSEALVRAVLSGIDQGFCVCELIVDDRGVAVDYRFLETNAQFEVATGLTDVVGRTALELVPGLESYWVESYAAVAYGDAPVRFEQGSDAMGRYFDVFAMPVEPRGRFALVFTDITEPRAALEALAESERRFRNMADHSPVIIWVTDELGECTYLNQLWFEVTGQSEAEALGRGWLDVAHPDDREAAASTFERANRERVAFSLDYRLRRRDGTYRWAVDAAAPRFGDDGRFLGYVGSVLDITDRKESEHAVTAERDRERATALQLQRAMLPSALVDDPRVDIASTYRAGAHHLTVGGDWYQTFRTADGRIGLVVGDVVGHNVEAAAAMGQLRAGLLALVPYATGPDDLLTELDRFAQQHRITDFATSLCVVLDPDDGTIVYSSAGHPPAMISMPDGSVHWLEGGRALPLGVDDPGVRPRGRARLETGAVLVMYSDGLVERRGESIDDGLARLARATEQHAGTPLDDLCASIVDSLTDQACDDDVVVVALRMLDAGRSSDGNGVDG